MRRVPDSREWWIYTEQSFPEPLAGPFENRDQAEVAARWAYRLEPGRYTVSWLETGSSGNANG